MEKFLLTTLLFFAVLSFAQARLFTTVNFTSIDDKNALKFLFLKNDSSFASLANFVSDADPKDSKFFYLNFDSEIPIEEKKVFDLPMYESLLLNDDSRSTMFLKAEKLNGTLLMSLKLSSPESVYEDGNNLIIKAHPFPENLYRVLLSALKGFVPIPATVSDTKVRERKFFLRGKYMLYSIVLSYFYFSDSAHESEISMPLLEHLISRLPQAFPDQPSEKQKSKLVEIIQNILDLEKD